ncbi:olfactory receptor 6M1-like [Microcaecilia unicolor]|uniref:Olfactory receptor n=1 Tax=Microcaecilia unicolor TaxID=1415580 RepID=A0A6P7WH60_9AMPH|nr:olfactory receptor 6M1-like [Microcaecilia unicolor]
MQQKTYHFPLDGRGKISPVDLWNRTPVTEFILVGFPGAPELQICLSVVFSIIYIITLMGNLLMIIIITSDYRLHTPMYFFLVSLSFLEICFISVYIPKLLVIFTSQKKSISFANCFIQGYFYYLLAGTDLSLLTTMSVDRYVAVCRPLRYATIMSFKVCVQMLVGCWLSGFLLLLVPTILLARSPFCGPNVVNHFFCDSSEVIRLACGDKHVIQLFILFVCTTYLIGSVLVIAMSYIYILSTIFRMSSATGRRKTLSTCTSHISMVSITFGTSIFLQVRARDHNSKDTDKVIRLVASVLPPLLNPFIYSLRNQKVKEAVKDAVRRNTLLSKI